MTDALPSAVLRQQREQIRALLAAHCVTHIGVFGSVARGEDRSGSDLDLAVTFGPGVRRDLVRITTELEELTGLSVDVVDGDRVMEWAQRTGVGHTILRDTVPL